MVDIMFLMDLLIQFLFTYTSERLGLRGLGVMQSVCWALII